MTPQQERNLRLEAVKRGYDRQKVESFVQFARAKERSETEAAPKPSAPAENPVKALAKDAFNALVVRPGTRVAQTLVEPWAVESSRGQSEAVAGLQKSLGDLHDRLAITADPARKEALKRHIAQVQSEIEKVTGARDRAAGVESRVQQPQKVELGPVGTYENSAPETYTQVAGEAAETASYLYTPGKALNVMGGTFANTVLRTSLNSAKVGAVSGSLYAAGKEAQRDDATAGSIVAEGAKGGIVGGVSGGVIGAAGSVAAKGTQLAKDKVAGLAQSLNADDSFVSRTSRRMQDIMDSRADMKAQPPAVQRAAKVDIAPETSRFVMGMSRQDKALAKSMVGMAKQAKDTLKPGVRPVEVPGRVILQPVNHVQRARESAGKALGEIVDGMEQKAFQPASATAALNEGFETLGITVGKGGKLDFSKSSITNASEQGILRRIAKDLGVGRRKPATLTPAQDHRMRQRIFGMLKTAKAKGELTYAQAVAEKVRGALKEDLIANTGAAGERYAAESMKYAKAEDALKDFYSLIGRKWQDSPDDLLALRAGEVGNRILGNASAAPLDVITRVEAVARELGYKGANNPVDLLIFNDLLEDLMGTTQTRSLRGQVSRGVRDASGNLAGIAEDAVAGNQAGMLKKAYDFAKGITPEEQMRELLRLLGE